MNEFLQQFLIESRELVAQATEGLLHLEQSPDDAECLDSVFRAFHTLKGGAGIVEFATMETTMHAAENLLAGFRSGSRTLNSALVSDSLACLDRVSQWLDTLERTGELPLDAGGGAHSKEEAATADAAARRQDGAPWIEALLDRFSSARGQAATAFRLTPDPDCFYRGEDPIARISSLPNLLALDLEPAAPWAPLADFDPYACNLVLSGLTSSSITEVSAHIQGVAGECELVAMGGLATEQTPETEETRRSLPGTVRDVLREQVRILEAKEASGAAGRLAAAGLTAANAMRFCGRDRDAETLAHAAQLSGGAESPRDLLNAIAELLAADPIARGPNADPMAQRPAADASVRSPVLHAPQRTEATAPTLRVKTEQIDALVRLTGELTVAKNAIGHTAKLARANGDSIAGLLTSHEGILNRLVAQLQSHVIGMRVLPLRSVFQRFPRALRELSANLGKPATLQVEGENTEADKMIIEMLFEPLLHVVRNAMDHGVEDAERRRRKGKPPAATILMRAARDGDQVLIEVSDDGAGIDVERVRSLAKQRGLADEENLRLMSESEVIDLVFAPGFSTAERVTEISGRGVGLDAVRTAVARVGGRVSIASRFDRGTTVSFSLPFSVMMTQVMTVEAGGEVFGIPLDVIVETVRVPREAFSGVGEARVIVQRNRTVPVIELDRVLDTGRPLRPPGEADATVIIAAVAEQFVGIHVDRPGERMEIMLKPLDGLLSGTPGIAGTTVLGDGRVLLVLDIEELLQ